MGAGRGGCLASVRGGSTRGTGIQRAGGSTGSVTVQLPLYVRLIESSPGVGLPGMCVYACSTRPVSTDGSGPVKDVVPGGGADRTVVAGAGMQLACGAAMSPVSPVETHDGGGSGALLPMGRADAGSKAAA